MRKYLTIIFMVSALAGNSQENWCGFDQMLEQSFQENEDYRLAVEEYVKNIHQGAALNLKRQEDKYIIPAVVHVTYADCESNISLAQIQDALTVLNDDYLRLNSDTNDTRSEFVQFASSSSVEFRLAQIDPDGNPTDGIVRIESSQSVDAGNAIKSVSRWPTDRYFNIWVVESIAGGGTTGTILGYAQFPNSGNWNNYGIVIRNDAMGRIGTSTADGRTLTHEVGHCLGLYHTFQSGCGNSCNSSGDFVCDTPPAASEPTYSCSYNINTCSNDQNGTSSPYTSDVPDQIENYMSYNSCQNMFTEGQKNVMIASLENVSRLQGLVSESNLIAAGVIGLNEANASAASDFVCESSQLQVFDKTKYDAQTFDWDFGPHAIPGTSSLKNPVVAFYESGLQSINYTMTDGSSSVSGSSNIFVMDKIGQYAPYEDDMEAMASFPTDEWFAINNDLDEHEWQLTNQASYSGSQSLMVDNFGICGIKTDALYSKSFDFSVFSSVNVEFKTAYAQTDLSSNDILRVGSSADCGNSWSYNLISGGATLAGNNAPQSTPFFPTDVQQWKTHSFSMNGSNMQEGIILRFEFVGRGGNNFFFDDLKITGEFNGIQLLKSPENGANGLTKDVVIDWKAVGGVDFYEYQIDQSANFSGLNLITGTKTYIDETPENEDTKFEALDLKLGTKYFWRVRYSDNGTLSDWSEIWTFNVSQSGVGISENNLQEEILLFPNPAQNEAVINSVSNISKIQVIEYTGRKISEENNIADNTYLLDLKSASPGVYLVIITTSNGLQTSKRLVVQ